MEAEPQDSDVYTCNFDRTYSRLSVLYDVAVRHTSLYSVWFDPALKQIRGPKVLEISFGTGWLLCHYANGFRTYGIELNNDMIHITRTNLRKAGFMIPLQQGKVEALPYASASFDTVVNTFAFSGYPRADEAMGEIRRVLRDGGRLVLLDIASPENGSWLGRMALRLFAASGDIVRDMGDIFLRHRFTCSEQEVGIFGSLHMYVAEKTRMMHW